MTSRQRPPKAQAPAFPLVREQMAAMLDRLNHAVEQQPKQRHPVLSVLELMKLRDIVQDLYDASGAS